MQLYTYNFLGLQSQRTTVQMPEMHAIIHLQLPWVAVRELLFRCPRCMPSYTHFHRLGSQRIILQMPEMSIMHPQLPWAVVRELPFRCVTCLPSYTHSFLRLESQNHRSDAWNVCQYTPTTSLGCRARELPFRCLRCLLIKALQETYWRNPPAVQAAGLRHIVREVTNGCNAAPCFCCVHPLGLQNDSLMLLTSKLEASSSKQQQKLFHLHSAPVVPSCTPILTTVSNCKTDPKKRQT